MSDVSNVNVPVVTAGGAQVGTVEVSGTILGGPVKSHLLYEVVKSQLAARRAGTHATKTWADVRGGGKKPWRQKGTGRARAGSIRSPLWPGGATIFGPQPRSYGYRLPKSARRAALCSALTDRFSGGKLIVVDAISLPEPKTKQMVAWLRGLGVDGSALVVTAGRDQIVERVTRNLPHAKALPVAGLNVYDILRYQTLIVTRDALSAIATRVGEAA